MRTVLLLSCVLALAACGTDDNDSAPTISNLSFTPATITVGQQTTLNGTFTFADPDGDATNLGVELTLPDQSKQALPTTPLQNVGTMTSGSIAWALIVTPPSPGTYKLALWILDAADNESNRLDGTITVQ
jgi:hypothetical protein